MMIILIVVISNNKSEIKTVKSAGNADTPPLSTGPNKFLLLEIARGHFHYCAKHECLAVSRRHFYCYESLSMKTKWWKTGEKWTHSKKSLSPVQLKLQLHRNLRCLYVMLSLTITLAISNFACKKTSAVYSIYWNCNSSMQFWTQIQV